MTANDIAHEIRFGNFTNEELALIVDSVRFRRSVLIHDVKRQLCVGARVSFISSRNGRQYAGTVSSVKIKYAIVNCGTSTFRVPCNMLTVA